MVMKRNAMRKNLTQSILRSLGRYLAVVAIIALGAGMFVGLLMTKTDMVATGQVYMDEQNMFDLRLISTYGWDRDSVEQISRLEGVTAAEGVFYQDAIAVLGDRDDAVYRFYGMPEQINRISLRGGRLPQAPDECLIDGFKADDSYLGMRVRISDVNDEDTCSTFLYDTYTVVGYVATPLYMDTNRGTTTVGNGSITTYFFVPSEGIDTDYFTEINLTIPGEYEVFTDTYNSALEYSAERLEPQVEQVAQIRFENIRTDAEEAYAEGYEAYLDGLRELEEGKLEAQQELADAYSKLSDAEREIAENEKKLLDGQNQINNAWVTIRENEKTLEEGKAELYATKETFLGPLKDARAELDKNAAEVEAGLIQVNDGITQIEEALVPVNDAIAQIEEAFSQLGEDNFQLEELQNLWATYGQQIQELYAIRAQLETELAGLQAEKLTLETSRATIDASYETINESQAAVDALFADSEAQIADGEAQLNSAKNTLYAKQQELDDGWAALGEGKEALASGWQEYYDGKAEAEAEIADAEAKLADAELELADAREEIDGLEAAELMILDRNSNVGYTSLDSASDIVQSVSKVFPAFFLLVASMVCITTMTRMIDEERTQIGTLKALGYSNGAIIGKYLIYAGSGAVIGCSLGLLVGSTAFPNILWQAYKNMLFVTDDMVLKCNWVLCAVVMITYTGVVMLVTWLCCRKALEEEPAELIRPKAPEAGRKIFLEYFPFWRKISFLNKVTLRNIFRYRQRFAMMMLGIGGCTALLLTGYGLRDSIVNVVNYQFEDVTVYDMAVYFREGQTAEQQDAIREELNDCVEQMLFYHQSSIEMDFDGRTKEIYLIAAGDGVQDYIDFHDGSVQLERPGTDEVLISVGAAEMLGVKPGDRVTMRNSDLQVLELTVSGVYDNHLYNYAVIAPETVEKQWGQTPEQQMAFVKLPDGADNYVIGARISSLDSVLNVSVSEDLADIVSGMINALDMVVWVVVLCAGLLAAIVLYNLTNININERIREVATIKVLGFRADETAMYVFKENLTLTVMGSMFGLGLGYLLLVFVMSNVKVDMVWFKTMVHPVSYLWAFLLTILSALLVDFIFYFKLEKINMAEALKSVE